MNDILKELVSKLPPSPTELNGVNLKKIHRYIPVPTDYDIFWADILSFGGYPAGIVLTNKAIIVKATREEVKNNKLLIKKQNKSKKTKEKIKAPKIIYYIIPWENYSPEDYELLISEDGKGKKRFVIKAGKTELAQFSSEALYNMLGNYKLKVIEQNRLAEAAFSAMNSVNTEGIMFNAAYGADQTKTGHGIYAEEAGCILDELGGEQSSVVGRDNAKNGPDKIVNASPIQCKYCKTAYYSVNSCFKRNVTTGIKTFRYYDLNGNTMKIEVPADQYVQAVEYMKTRINNGNVPGVTDPNMAYDIIRKGKITYKQALNLAKAGNIESISFDALSGAVNCLSALGISSMVAFAQTFWATKDYKKATKSALYTGMQVYGLSFAGGIVASQISRTGITKSLSSFTTEIGKSMSPQTVQNILNAFRTLAGKKAIYGAAAQKSFAKFLSSTAITQGIMILFFSMPDTYRVIAHKISGSQYCKNMLSLLASVGGSVAVTTATGMLLGMSLGGKVNKIIGTGVGMGAGIIGGAAFGGIAKGICNILHEDDVLITTRLFNAVTINLFIENMLSDKEQNIIIECLNKEEKNLRELHQSLLHSDSQEKDIVSFLEPKINMVIDKRKKISVTEDKEIDESLASAILEGDI